VDASQNVSAVGSLGTTIASKTAEFNAAGGSIYSSYNDGTKTWRTGVGIFAAGQFSIRNATDSLQAIDITSAGNVGIGRSSPTQKLDIGGNALVQITNSYHCYTTDYGIGTPDGSGLQIFYGAGDFIRFGNRTAGTFTERVRINSDGNLLVGSISSNARLVVKGTSGDGFGGGVQWIKGSSDNRWEFVVGGDSKFYLGYGSGATPATVGNFATNGVYTATSDVRKKKDISYEFEGLSLVQALKPAMGRMLDDESSFPLRPFFIAQDIQPVLPSLVSSLDPDSSALNPFLGVDYASIAPVLVKAIQEQQAIIQTLTDRITALEGAK
jgi:hypothetical protein